VVLIGDFSHKILQMLYTRTGEIVDAKEVLKMSKEERKHFVEISKDEEKEVFSMNRHERRKWAKRQRSKK